MRPRRLRIGTRGSRLALAQTELVRRALAAAHPELAAPGALEVVPIRTTGDRVTDRPLAELGGKGLFCKEIEAALLARRIDLAVHSIKDLPTWLPDGLIVGAVLEREDPRDVLIARPAATIAELPEAAVIGTSSMRRKAQLLARRPDLRVVDFRGNVDSRLRKLAAGEVDATLLALAGLRRLGIEDAGIVALSMEEMLPAVGQGAVGVESRADDAVVLALLAAIDHPSSSACVRAERALLAALDGSCHTPIAGRAEIAAGRLHLRALVARTDGSECLRTERTGLPDDAERLGEDAGAELRARAGPAFFA
jgi:hydroxymethylbilane synthase